MTLKHIVYGLCFALGVGLATPRYAIAEERLVAPESRAVQILGEDATIDYNGNHINLCFKANPLKADDIELARSLTKEGAEIKLHHYLNQVTSDASARALTLNSDGITASIAGSNAGGKRVYALDNPRVCTNLDFYNLMTVEAILKDADPVERVLSDPFISQASHIDEVVTHSSCSSSGGCIEETPAVKAQTTYQAIKVTNLALPYALATNKLMEQNGFTSEMEFNIWSKFADKSGGVITLSVAESLYHTTVASIEAIKKEKSERK
ncbi:MAG: hypothetical protein WCV90_06140 [Candidatus Woesearchaeota archaeon]|jgi:hypothetical protein